MHHGEHRGSGLRTELEKMPRSPLEHQHTEQLPDLSPETQPFRRGPNCLSPGLKALECCDHVRAPENQARPFSIALLVSLWGARTLEWMP